MLNISFDYMTNLCDAIHGEMKRDFEAFMRGNNPRISPARMKKTKRLFKLLDMTSPKPTNNAVHVGDDVQVSRESSDRDEALAAFTKEGKVILDDFKYHNCTLISIDAWRDSEGGWDWNDMHKVEHDIMISEDSDILSNSRKCLAWFRQQGWLTDASKGKVRVDFNDDIIDGILIVIENKNTGEPILALSSIH